jgi:hypothetical protein
MSTIVKMLTFVFLLSMRHLYITILSLFYMLGAAQDTLYFKDSGKIAVLLLENSGNLLKYKRFDNQAGPAYLIPKNEVYMIAYFDGTRDSVLFLKSGNLADQESKSFRMPALPADTIYFRSGKVALSQVLLIQGDEIKYQLWEHRDGPVYKDRKSEIKLIHFGTGLKQFFEEAAPTGDLNAAGNWLGSNYALYQKGKMDAFKYYQRSAGSYGVGCTAAGCGPLVGLIPALIVANVEPRNRHLDIPVSAYSSHPDYLNGYKEAAHKIKRKKVWIAFGTGSAIFAALLLAAQFLVI